MSTSTPGLARPALAAARDRRHSHAVCRAGQDFSVGSTARPARSDSPGPARPRTGIPVRHMPGGGMADGRRCAAAGRLPGSGSGTPRTEITGHGRTVAQPNSRTAHSQMQFRNAHMSDCVHPQDFTQFRHRPACHGLPPRNSAHAPPPPLDGPVRAVGRLRIHRPLASTAGDGAQWMA